MSFNKKVISNQYLKRSPDFFFYFWNSEDIDHIRFVLTVMECLFPIRRDIVF